MNWISNLNYLLYADSERWYIQGTSNVLNCRSVEGADNNSWWRERGADPDRAARETGASRPDFKLPARRRLAKVPRRSAHSQDRDEPGDPAADRPTDPRCSQLFAHRVPHWKMYSLLSPLFLVSLNHFSILFTLLSITFK